MTIETSWDTHSIAISGGNFDHSIYQFLIRFQFESILSYGIICCGRMKCFAGRLRWIRIARVKKVI